MVHKRAAVLLLLFVLLTTGCRGGVEPPTASTAETPSTTQANATEASTSAAQAAVGFDFALYEPEDYCIDYRSFVGNTGGGSPMVETEDSIYLLSKGFLYFSDKEYKDFMPLCARPNCSHDSADCDAYIGALAIQYRNGYIYYVSDCAWDIDAEQAHLHTPSVCRMRRDGSQHEELLKLPLPVSGNGDLVPESDWWECFASNKYFVLRFNRIAYDEYNTPVHDLHMLSVDMDTLAVTELLTDPSLPDDTAACFMMLEGRGDLIYGQMNYKAFELGKNKIVEIDLVTGSMRELCTFEPVLRSYEIVSSLRGDGLYFIDFDLEHDVKTLYCLNVKTCELSELRADSVLHSSWKTFDSYSGYYFGLANVRLDPSEWGVYVTDPAFNTVEFLPFDDLPAEYLDYYGGLVADALEQYPDLENTDQSFGIELSFITRDYVFAAGPSIGVHTYYIDAEDENGDTVKEEHHTLTVTYNPFGDIPGWYIIKADIGTGNLQWHRWAPGN